MNRNNVSRETLVFFVVVLFFCVSVIPGFGVVSEDVEEQSIVPLGEKSVTCYFFDRLGNGESSVVLSSVDFSRFFSVFEELNNRVAYDPFSDETRGLKLEFAVLLDGLGLIPEGVSKTDVISLMSPVFSGRKPLFSLPSVSGGRGSAFFCNFATLGEGSQFPVIILPRLIPILLLPIPRVIMHWDAYDGITSCGGLRSGKGFIALGAQQGTALGFWGVGFSVFLPPVMSFGFIGYALFATATADEIELWPPNRPPVVSDESPLDGAVDVPVDLSELSFRIDDPDGDRMNYTVSTSPDIGSGQGQLKKNGVYSVFVDGLEGDKMYSWTVELSDGNILVEKKFSFITEGRPPFDPFTEGWMYRKKIIINHTLVTGDLVNFPVLVSVVDSDLVVHAQFDGDDVLFMDGLGVAKKLYHEIEFFDGSSGELVAWVKVPSLSSGVDTVFYLYYGNPSCSNQEFSEKVWDSDFCGVWHLDDFYDSTFNSNDGTNHGTNKIAGMIGDARDFEKNNSAYIDWGDLPEPANGEISAGTFEMWVKPDQFIGAPICKANSGDYEPDRLSYFLWLFDGKIGFWALSGTWYPSQRRIYTITNEPYIITGNWQHVAAVVDLSVQNMDLFYNGQEKDSTKTVEGSPPLFFYNIALSEESGKTVSESGATFYNGVIDELRISKICRSSSWISTEYNNQNNPSSFLSFGMEETPPLKIVNGENYE